METNGDRRSEGREGGREEVTTPRSLKRFGDRQLQGSGPAINRLSAADAVGRCGLGLCPCLQHSPSFAYSLAAPVAFSLPLSPFCLLPLASCLLPFVLCLERPTASKNPAVGGATSPRGATPTERLPPFLSPAFASAPQRGARASLPRVTLIQLHPILPTQRPHLILKRHLLVMRPLGRDVSAHIL